MVQQLVWQGNSIVGIRCYFLIFVYATDSTDNMQIIAILICNFYVRYFPPCTEGIGYGDMLNQLFRYNR